MTHRDSGRTPAGRTTNAFALGWGFADATFFFLLPDILLTRVALHDLRRAGRAAAWALAGSLLGGAIVWSLAHAGSLAPLFRTFELLPGINLGLVRDTGTALLDSGYRGLFQGLVLGQPFKLFAAHAGAQEISLVGFLATAALALLLRFAAAICLAALASRLLSATSMPLRERLHALAWAAFYLVSFLAAR